MKKWITFVLLIGLVTNVYAQSFPTLKHYVVNGIVLSNDLTYKAMLKQLGKPTRIEKIRNDCAETTYSYYYYPGLTLIDRGGVLSVDEIYFSNTKNQVQLSSLSIDANTTAAAIKAFGRLDVSVANGVTTYRLEDTNDPSAWIFDFKASRLYRVSFFFDDC